MHRLQELVRLHRLGTGAREVARLLKMSPNTERAYRLALEKAEVLRGSPKELPSLEELKQAVMEHRPPSGPPKHELSSIEEWTGRVQALMEKKLKPRAIYDRLRLEEPTFKGTYWAVKRLYRRLRRERGVRAEEVAIPVETGPGEIAQVDFGYVGKLLCPQTQAQKRAWVFVMVLAYSRHMYAEVVFDQKLATWIGLHQRAFAAFGGVPETIVPDNLKAAVIRAAFGIDGDSALNRSYRELARHYGFKVDPTPPYSPKKKGKVESAVKYVKHNALAGREGQDITTVNKALTRWNEEIAGQRQHGTTGRKPLELFQQEEVNALRPMPTVPYESRIWSQAKVHQDTCISFQGRLYSVPWRWVGKQVWVMATPSTVAIYFEDVRIATHPRNGPGKRSMNESHLPEHRRDLRHRSRSDWEERAAGIGPETANLVKEVFDSDDVLSQLRKVQAIVTHLEKFPVSRAEAASRRAVFYGTYSYKGVKSILDKTLDLEPLPIALTQEDPSDEHSTYQFARSVSELLAAMEVSDEPH
jgi:transposase